MKKILITGGAGFIGSNLAHYFDNNFKDIDILVIDKFRNNERFSNNNLKSFGHFKNLLGFSGNVISADINDKSTMDLISDYAPDIIYHQAAISDTTVIEQDELIKTNVNSFFELLKICQKHNSKMIYASSAATYGNALSPQKVWHGESPNNAYGFSKLSMDHTAMRFAKQTGVYVVGLRYFNVYGKGEFFKEKTASMVLQFGLQILSGKNPKLFEGSDKILRDFVYIGDVVAANVNAMNAKSGVYNVGTGNARSFQDIVDILQSLLKTNLPCEYIPNPYSKSYQFHTQADISSTKDILGYEPKYTLELGIADYLDEIKRIYKELS